MPARARVRWIALAALLVGMGGCASQATRFDALDPTDRQRFAACRHHVALTLCEDEQGCDARIARVYADLPPDERRSWLRDYGCPEDRLREADREADREASQPGQAPLGP